MDACVVTCFLRDRGEVLLRRRSEGTDSAPGRWDAITGRVDGDRDPDAAAHEAIAAETGLDAAALVRRGEPFATGGADGETRRIHPYSFDCERRAIESNGATNHEWTHPTEIRRRETVPGLREAYERVAPTVETVASDAEHGAATISVRALEVLRDRAGALADRWADGGSDDRGGTDDCEANYQSVDGSGVDGRGENWTKLAALARDLRAARPSMVVVENRINRAMSAAARERGQRGAAMAVERAARAGIERACTADEGAARAAAGRLDGARVLTLSRSSTVRRALRRAAPERVLVAESRPAREGVGVAEALVGDNMDVTLLVDAAVAHVLAERGFDAVLVGADTVLPDGTLVNKVGTRAAALAAAREGVPLYVVAATDKIGTRDEPDFEAGDPRAVYDGDAPLDAANPTFDATPPDLLAGFLTEEGPLDPGAAGAVAAELRALADWPGSGCSAG